MTRRSRLGRRLAAIGGAAICLVALALLWQLRPAQPPLPQRVGAVFSTAFISDAIHNLLWLTLAALTLVLLARFAAAGARAGRADANAGRGGRQSPPPQAKRSSRPPLLDGAAASDLSGNQTSDSSGSYVPSWRRPRLTVAHTDAAPTPAACVAAVAAPSPGEAKETESVETETAARQTRPRVLLLGPFEIPSRTRRRRRSPGPAHELIAYLALNPQGASRDQLLEALWPHESPQRSEQRFWQASKEARQLLDGAINRHSGRYQLDRTHVDLDIDELETLLAQTGQAADELAEHDLLEQALALFRGQPLEGSDYRWADGPRRRLAATHLELLDRVANARLLVGDARGALETAEQAIAADNLNEESWRLALQAEAATGSRQAVTRRYDELARLLDERLGIEPDRQTRRLYLRLLGPAEAHEAGSLR